MNAIEDRALNEREAAEFLGVSPTSLRILRSVGERPHRMKPVPFFRLGARCIRYSLADLHEYRESFRVDPDGEAV